MDEKEVRSVAIEELKVIQSIIARQDNIIFKVKSWLVTLQVAITTVFISGKVNLGKLDYFVGSIIIILLFLYMEMVYRVASDRAVMRSKEVEKNIRDGGYDGPKIGMSFQPTIKAGEMWRSFNNARTFTLYLVLAIIISLICLTR